MDTARLKLLVEHFHRLCRNTIPPVYFLSALVLMYISSYFLPVSHLIYVPLRVFGILLVIAGLVLGSWSIMLFRQAGTPLQPFEKPVNLVRTGPYKYSRNPVYLGMLIMLTGIWIALGTFSPLFVLLLFFYIIQEAFVKQEELFLEEHFGDDYRQYCRNVRRWI